jgi:hypothetical protein
MRRLGLVIVGLTLCIVSAACTSSTSPDQKRDGWLSDGTWCSGYINPNGECVDGL